MTALILALFLLSPAPNSEPNQSLVKAEIAFSNASEQSDTATAFTSFLAADGLLMRPNGHLNGQELYTKQKPKGTLVWRPEMAIVSASGDFGYTSGPYQFSRPTHQDDEEPPKPSYGHFVSLWKKDEAGQWQVIYDGGIFHKGGPRKSWKTASKDKVLPKAWPQDGSFDQANSQFLKAATRKSMREAFIQHGAENTRLYQPGRSPATDLTTVVARAHTGPVTLTEEGKTVAAGNDLAYTYGTQTEAGAKGAVKRYLSIWQRQKSGQWRVVLHLTNPKI